MFSFWPGRNTASGVEETDSVGDYMHRLESVEWDSPKGVGGTNRPQKVEPFRNTVKRGLAYGVGCFEKPQDVELVL